MLALFTFSDDPKKNLQHVPPPSIPSLIGKLQYLMLGSVIITLNKDSIRHWVL